MEVDRPKEDQEMAPEEPSPVKDKSKDVKMESPDKKPQPERRLRAHKEPKQTSTALKVFKKEEIKERKGSKQVSAPTKNSENNTKMENSEKRVIRRSTRRKSRK